ncbi:hypothetical protein [uncultured Winogradskyella sp.]|uniref:hypothetical protein n=1 Tax=uncultured Winogradskyella sp. TaxID=395353 RepID=UPI00262D0EC3|nr:hypothetical protein [uncultured Winogradskyella sp.]
MKFIPTTKDSIALTLATIIVLGLFTAGLFEVLNYFIVKVVLLLSFSVLFIMAFGYAIKNETKKNRPEDILQDDSH